MKVIEEKGVKVLIEPKAIMYLLGTRDGLQKEKFSSHFIFKNLTKLSVAVAVSPLKFSRYNTSQIQLDAYAQIYRFLGILTRCMHQSDHQ